MEDKGEDEARNQPLLGHSHVDSVEEDNLFVGIQLEETSSGNEILETRPHSQTQSAHTANQIPTSHFETQPTFSAEPQSFGAQVMGAPVYDTEYAGFPEGREVHGHSLNQTMFPQRLGPQPGGFMHLPDLPDAIEHWNQQRPILRAWLILSIVTLIVGFGFWPGMLVGLLGTIAGSMHVCKCCKGDPSLAGPILTTYILAIICAVVDCLLSTFLLIQLSFGCSRRGEEDAKEEGVVEAEVEKEESGEAECITIIVIIFLIFVWFAAHACLSVLVAHKADHVRKLLNPITSGVVVL